MARLSLAGADLYVEVVGSGDPVLMLHGGFCSLKSLRAQSDALAIDHEVHAFERPGHGRSADSDDEYSYEAGVAQALAYLDGSGLETAHVIGYSDGAIIGLLLAIAHPERVRSLVAISANLDPSGFTHSPEAVGTPLLSPIPAVQDVDELDVERDLYDFLSPDGPGHAQVVLDKLFRLWTTEPHIAPDELARIVAPTLIMAGERDSIRLDHTVLMASSIPGAQLCIVPGAGHGLVDERPGVISRVIREFLQRVPLEVVALQQSPPSGRVSATERRLSVTRQ